MSVSEIAAQSRCPSCIKGHPYADYGNHSAHRRYRYYHSVYGTREDGREYTLRGEFTACLNSRRYTCHRRGKMWYSAPCAPQSAA